MTDAVRGTVMFWKWVLRIKRKKKPTGWAITIYLKDYKALGETVFSHWHGTFWQLNEMC